MIDEVEATLDVVQLAPDALAFDLRREERGAELIRDVDREVHQSGS